MDPAECLVQYADGQRRSVDLSAATALDKRHANLHGLELRRCQVDQHLPALRRLLVARPSSLLLEDCALSDRAAAELAEQSTSSALDTLALRRCRPLSMTAVLSLASLLESASLVHLELASCGLARQAGILLGQSLPACRGLQRVLLRDNSLRDGGVRAIADGLRLATSLRELDVSANGVTSLAALLAVPAARLVASDNAIAALPSPLALPASLRALVLSGNPLSAEATRALWWHVWQQPARHQLRELHLQRCGVAAAALRQCWRQQAKAVVSSSSTTLRLVYLGEEEDDDEEFVELQREVEARVAGLHVRLLPPEEEEEMEEEVETPGRRTRRELLERTEFLRRRSEEDVSEGGRASLVSDSLLLLGEPPSLDDVASQFSSSSFVAAVPATAAATAMAPLPLACDVERIVARTVESMNRQFEQQLAQFLLKMEFQQQEKNASQLQTLAAKVEACERAIPRLEARLDVLADRLATSGAQAGKLSQGQVDEAVRQQLQGVADPRAVVEAVSMHLTQFKREFDANQASVLRQFTENIVKDGLRVDERMQQLERKVSHLEGVIQAEQHASLLALEAISDAFTSRGPVHTSQISR